MNTHLLLKDAARLLRVKPWQITHALSAGHVAEPALRIGNRRIFQATDLAALATYFTTTGKQPAPANSQEVTNEH